MRIDTYRYVSIHADYVSMRSDYASISCRYVCVLYRYTVDTVCLSMRIDFESTVYRHYVNT